jgi:hypothetical protein
MGTDREELTRELCSCGDGEIVIYRLTPDHGWPSNSVSWDGRLECDPCSATYTMYAAATECPRVALIADVLEKERRFEDWNSADKALMASAPVQGLVDRLTNRIEKEPSIAAKYRLLKELCYHRTYGSINRHWRGAPAWVNEWIRSSSLPAVLRLLGEDDPILVSEAERIAELWKLSQQPVPPAKTGGE